MRSRWLFLLLAVLFAACLFGLIEATGTVAAGRQEAMPSSADLTLLPNSLTPLEVVQSEPVSFKVRVRNDGLLAVTVTTTSAFTFADAAGLGYTAHLSDTATIEPGAEKGLQFALVAAAAALQPGAYPYTVQLAGEDAAGAAFDLSLSPGDTITAWPDRTELALAPGSMMPTRPDRYSEALFWIDVENSGACAIDLDATRSRLILSGDEVNWQDVPLDRAESIAPGQRRRIYSAGFNQYGIPDGLYTPGFKLIGANACDGSTFSAFVPADAQTDIGWAGSDEHSGAGCTGGSEFTFNQFGGESEGLAFSVNVDGDRQHLVEHAPDCQWEGCDALFDAELIRFSDGPFGYYNPADGPYLWTTIEFRSTAGIPREVNNLLIVRHYNRSVAPCAGCVGVRVGCRHDTYVRVVDRQVDAGIKGMWAEDTFLPRGYGATVAVEVFNPEQLTTAEGLGLVYETAGKYVVEPGSALRALDASGKPVASFASSLQDVDHRIEYSITHPVRFTLAAAADAPLGKLHVGTELTVTGLYQGWDGVHTLEGFTSTVGLEASSVVHVVEQAPLDIAPGSAIPAHMPPFGPPPPLTVTLQNVSEWPFTLAATRTLTLPVRLVNPLYLALAVPPGDATAQGSTVSAVAQSIRPEHDFLLGKISFDFCDGAGLPPPARIKLARPRPEVRGVGATVAEFELPEYVPGAAKTFDTPPFNIWLRKGETYLVVIESPDEGLCVRYGSWDIYPNGGFMLLYPNGWNPFASGDLSVRLYAQEVRYEAAAIAPGPASLPPGASIDLAFPTGAWTKAIAPGLFTPSVRLSGTYDDGAGWSEFSQTVVGDGAEVRSPETRPVTIDLVEGRVVLRWVDLGSPAWYYDVWRGHRPDFAPGDYGSTQISGTLWAAALPGGVVQLADVSPYLVEDIQSYYLVRAVNSDESYTPVSDGALGVFNFGLVSQVSPTARISHPAVVSGVSTTAHAR